MTDKAKKSAREEMMDRLTQETRESRDSLQNDDEAIEYTEEPDNYYDYVEDDDNFITVKVDGEELQVPAEDILDAGIRTYQKESAADKRLEEATAKLKEAEDYLSNVQNEPLPDYSYDDGDTYEDDGRGEATLDRDEIVRQATEEAYARLVAKQAHDEAMDRFGDKYPEIYQDEILLKRANDRKDELIQSGHAQKYESYWELYDAVGDEIMGWMQDKGFKTHDEPEPEYEPDPIEEREFKKAEIDEVEGGDLPSGDDSPRPRNREAAINNVVDQMKKSRHA